MNEKILLTNIQKFSLHDGPGIRTTIFLKGCSLRCPWCSNPENIEFKEQNYIKDGVAGIYGKWMTCDEIYAEIIKDIDFYGLFSGGEEIKNLKYLEKLPGGVTFSGGEPLLQIDKLVSLLKKLKTKNIHTAGITVKKVENKKYSHSGGDLFVCGKYETGDLN